MQISSVVTSPGLHQPLCTWRSFWRLCKLDSRLRSWMAMDHSRVLLMDLPCLLFLDRWLYCLWLRWCFWLYLWGIGWRRDGSGMEGSITFEKGLQTLHENVPLFERRSRIIGQGFILHFWDLLAYSFLGMQSPSVLCSTVTSDVVDDHNMWLERPFFTRFRSTHSYTTGWVVSCWKLTSSVNLLLLVGQYTLDRDS